MDCPIYEFHKTHKITHTITKSTLLSARKGYEDDEVGPEWGERSLSYSYRGWVQIFYMFIWFYSFRKKYGCRSTVVK